MLNTSSKSVLIISYADREWYNLVNCVVIMCVISVLGVAANVINIVVFYKQGFASTMNISFFGLAISDLCNVIMLIWYSICVNPLFINSNLPAVWPEVMYLTAGLPHICFARITSWITVYVTAERCLCILLPLKIKQIITTRRTTVILVLIYVLIISSFLPEYATIYIGWKFYPERGKDLLGLVFTEHRASVEGLFFIMYSVIGSVSFAAVILFTALLVVQLRRKSKWRATATTDKSSSESISNRERKAVAMVIMITMVLIVCYIPGVAISLITFFEPEFSIVGEFVNSFFAFWSFALVFDALNSSVNIFLYYKMSTKYRETFNQIFYVSTSAGN